MRVLFALDNYDHGSGGAEMAVRSLASALAERGHQVEVLQRDDVVKSYERGAIRIHTRPLPMPRLIRNRDRDTLRWNEFWSRILEDFLRDHPADLIITQNRVLYSTVEVARAHEIPVVVWGHAWGMLCPMQFKTRDPASARASVATACRCAAAYSTTRFTAISARTNRDCATRRSCFRTAPTCNR